MDCAIWPGSAVELWVECCGLVRESDSCLDFTKWLLSSQMFCLGSRMLKNPSVTRTGLAVRTFLG